MSNQQTLERTAPAALRADAQRNRERILAAARELMAERGAAVEMTEIAEAAGVGVGTLYRRFPDKQALILELLREKFQELAAALERELAREEVSARERLHGYIRAACAIQGADRGLQEAFSAAIDDHSGIAQSTPGLLESTERLVAEAVAEGSVRPDLEWEDVVTCCCALGHVIQHQDSLPGSWQRLLQIQLDGLDRRAVERE
jgi:AcrR family transcriptional regulator